MNLIGQNFNKSGLDRVTRFGVLSGIVTPPVAQTTRNSQTDENEA